LNSSVGVGRLVKSKNRLPGLRGHIIIKSPLMSEYILTSRRWAVYRLIAAVVFLPLFAVAALGAVKVTDLRCESLVNPQGIDAIQPRLSWILQSKERGRAQYAYQILVASSAAKLKAGQADLWDSGRVVSPQSVLVPYGGSKLSSHQECSWKVRVWSDEKTVSAWSSPAHWTMGFLDPDEWEAKWIGLDQEEVAEYLVGPNWIWHPGGNPAVAAPLETNWFRKEITIPTDRRIKRAIFEYTGDNECRGWLDEFDLGARNNPRLVKWNDITTRLEPGRTYVFGLVGRNTGMNEDPAGIIGSLVIEFETGDPIVVRTDDTWKVTRELHPGWNRPGFDDSGWVMAQILGPAGMAPWGPTRTAEERKFPARWLRKEFALDQKIQRATVYYSGLGSSEVYLNGQKVGDAVLSPALSQYNKRVFYVTHDVTRLLRRGNNAIGAVLGGGRFASDRSQVYTGTVNFGWPKLLLHFRIEHADGSVREIVSDESWQLTTDGPIRASGEFDGETYDARKELVGWSQAGYDHTNWQPAEVVEAPTGQLSAQMIEPIRVTEMLRPIAMREVKPGVFVYDLGQNMVGWARLNVRGPAGQTVQMRFAETVNADGTLNRANLRSAKATDTFTLKGSGREIWEPRFTYHGFRYVEVTGYPGKPNLSAVEGRVVNDDLRRAGEFACSNELLNQIYRNVLWGTRGNYRSIPTDCPQRDERQGWLGDRSAGARGETYLFDVASFYAKWTQDISDAQRDSGSLPDVAPAFWSIYSDNVTWPSTLIIAPDFIHRQYGDLAPIANRYDSARRWLDYMNRFVTNGIIARDNYGDWCVPPESPVVIHTKDLARQTDKSLLATAYYYQNLRLMERYAKILGNPADADAFAAQAAEMKIAFNQRFLNRAKGYYDNGTQTSCVLPLAFGLMPDDFRERVFARLVDSITNETQGHIGTGLIGGQYLCRVLSDHGRADLVYGLATKTTYPSWGYMVANGATTIWELWNGNTADPTMNSGNHVMLVGDLVIWFYEYAAGIAADPAQPGFKHIIMKPHPVGDLKFARATHHSPYGLITSDWRKTESSKQGGARFEWSVEIPANTTATVYVPAMPRRIVTESGKPIQKVRGATLLNSAADRIVIQLASGKYKLSSE
jgi:alpha-L-rhamnosidase